MAAKAQRKADREQEQKQEQEERESSQAVEDLGSEEYDGEDVNDNDDDEVYEPRNCKKRKRRSCEKGKLATKLDSPV